MKAKLYNIFWTDCYGEQTLVATTNDTDRWLEENNERRIADEEEPEDLDDFIIEEAEVYIYKKSYRLYNERRKHEQPTQ